MEEKDIQSTKSIGYLLMQTSFLKQRMTNIALQELGITYIQFVILISIIELGENKTLVTQQTIVSKCLLDKAMVSNVVKTLIDKNLIIRKIHPTDRRAFTLELTPTGTEKALAGKVIAKKVDDAFFIGINENKFKQTLITLLQKNSNNDLN